MTAITIILITTNVLILIASSICITAAVLLPRRREEEYQRKLDRIEADHAKLLAQAELANEVDVGQAVSKLQDRVGQIEMVMRK